MKIKKTLAVLLSAALLAGGLSGCSKPAADNKADSADAAKDTDAPKADGGITITMVESLTSPDVPNCCVPWLINTRLIIPM